MLETPHVAVGAAIASKIPNPFIAIPLALASHLMLDRVPHWNPHFYTETQKFGMPRKQSIVFAAADVSVSLILGLFIAYQTLPNVGQALLVLACSFAAVFPDVSKSPYFFLKNRSKMLKNWVTFERSIQVETKPFWGILTQIAVITLSLVWIFGT